MGFHSCKFIHSTRALLSMCNRLTLPSSGGRDASVEDRLLLPRRHVTTSPLKRWTNPDPFGRSLTFIPAFDVNGSFESTTRAAPSSPWMDWGVTYLNLKTQS